VAETCAEELVRQVLRQLVRPVLGRRRCSGVFMEF